MHHPPPTWLTGCLLGVIVGAFLVAATVGLLSGWELCTWQGGPQ